MPETVSISPAGPGWPGLGTLAGLRNRRDLTRAKLRVGRDDLYDDRGDVVDSTVVVCVGDHRVDDSLGSRRSLKELLKPPVLHHAGQAVARQEKHVADLRLTADDRRLDVAAHTDAARDHVTLRMVPCLLRGYQARVQLFLHQRMIARELPHLAVANEIDPRVAHMPNEIMRV